MALGFGGFDIIRFDFLRIQIDHIIVYYPKLLAKSLVFDLDSDRKTLPGGFKDAAPAQAQACGSPEDTIFQHRNITGFGVLFLRITQTRYMGIYICIYIYMYIYIYVYWEKNIRNTNIQEKYHSREIPMF